MLYTLELSCTNNLKFYRGISCDLWVIARSENSCCSVNTGNQILKITGPIIQLTAQLKGLKGDNGNNIELTDKQYFWKRAAVYISKTFTKFAMLTAMGACRWQVNYQVQTWAPYWSMGNIKLILCIETRPSGKIEALQCWNVRYDETISF